MYQVLNEPMVPLGQGYLSGEFPPGIKNPLKFLKALNNIADAYKKSYAIIKKKYPNSLVGISYLYNWYESQGLGVLEKIVDRIASWYRIDLLAKKIKNHQDYFGVDYYRIGRMKLDLKNPMYAGFRIEEDKANIMGWIANPEGMYKVLKQAWRKYRLPIYVIENGTPTDTGIEDKQRIAYLKGNLKWVHQAISEGVDVRGYNHWSLMDNFEWLSGYRPRFGLIEVDYKTLERKPRQSFYEYAKICKSNVLEMEN
jgi:beta-glucosidase